MGRQHEVRRTSQRVVGAHRLDGIDVNGGTAEVARTESGGERGLIHDSAARNVEDDRSWFRGLELGNAHEPPGLRCQWRVDGDDVRSMEELWKPDQACTHFGGLLLGQVRIVREHPHLEANCATGDGFADLPEADDPERLAPQLGAGEA